MMIVVTHAEVLRPYVLRVTFSDGSCRDVDVEPLLTGPVFQPLRDTAFFNKVTVDVILGTVTWPNGADLSPEFLFDAQSAA